MLVLSNNALWVIIVKLVDINLPVVFSDLHSSELVIRVKQNIYREEISRNFLML
jgi:hypothetical protein